MLKVIFAGAPEVGDSPSTASAPRGSSAATVIGNNENKKIGDAHSAFHDIIICRQQTQTYKAHSALWTRRPIKPIMEIV